jgi:two-component system, OmpR family, sensor histidine kinase KdpD
MLSQQRRKTPEELLRACQAEEEDASQQGRLKIFLGYASGVGKSFRMLDEARRRRERGQDVVVGAIQPDVPLEVAPILGQLEVVPLKSVGNGAAIDLDKLIARHPEVCVIDGLAYDNPPGQPNTTRWEDVRALLNAGIGVIASINIQYIAELSDRVEAITGKRADQTVPLAFVQGADEIEIVDAPPLESMERSPDEQLQARKYEERLSKLRELALVVAADVVDWQLNEYLERHGMAHRFGAHERIMVCITPRANMQEMLAAAQMVAKRFHGELLVAYVRQAQISAADQSALDAKLAMANAAGAHIEVLEGADPAEALLQFARARGVTQIYVGHSQRTGLASLKGSPLDRLIWESHGMDVCVFPQSHG